MLTNSASGFTTDVAPTVAIDGLDLSGYDTAVVTDADLRDLWAYLKSLPIQRIKLDRAFVRDIETDSNDAAISAATIALRQCAPVRRFNTAKSKAVFAR